MLIESSAQCKLMYLFSCSLGVFCSQVLYSGCLQCGKYRVAWDRVRNAPRVLCNDVQTALSRIDPVQQVCADFFYHVLLLKGIVKGNSVMVKHPIQVE